MNWKFLKLTQILLDSKTLIEWLSSLICVELFSIRFHLILFVLNFIVMLTFDYSNRSFEPKMNILDGYTFCMIDTVKFLMIKNLELLSINRYKAEVYYILYFKQDSLEIWFKLLKQA